MNPNDLVSQMLAATQGQQQVLSQASSGLDKVSEALGQSNAAVQTMGAQYVEQAASAAKQKAAVEYSQNIVKQNAQAQLGLNPDEVQNEIAKSLASINSVQSAKKAALQEYNDATSQSFLSNPVGYILGQFKANDAAGRFNAATSVEEVEYGNIQARTTALNQIKTTVSANTADAILQSQLTAAEADANLASIKFEQAKSDSLSKQSGIWMQQTDLRLKSAGLIKEDIRFRQERQNFEEARAERAENRALRAAQFAELRANKATAVAAANAQAERLAAVSDFIGRPGQITPDTIKGIKDRKLQTDIVNAADTLTMGSTLMEGVDLIRQAGNPQIIVKQNPGVAQLVQGASQSIDSRTGQLIEKSKKGTTKPMKLEDARLEAAGDYQDELEKAVGSPKATKAMNHPGWDTEFNLYKAPYEQMVDAIAAGNIPGLANNQVAIAATTLLKTKTDDKRILGSDETLIFKSIAEQVVAQKLSPIQAAQQIKQFYDTAAMAGLSLHQYDRFAMPVPDSYFVQVPIPTLGSTLPIRSSEVKPVNLRNAASIEKSLAAYVVGSRPKIKPIEYSDVAPNPAMSGQFGF